MLAALLELGTKLSLSSRILLLLFASKQKWRRAVD
jgi:hypothetical protein